MKRIKIITAALSLLIAATLFAGCNNQTGESAQVSRIEGGQTKISVDNGGSNAASGTYKFSYKGYEICLGDTMGKVSEIFGEPNDIKDGASCAFGGFDVEYYYSGLEFDAMKPTEDTDDAIAVLYTIVITDPLIDCGGIHVGQTFKDAKTIYGDPFEEDDFGASYRSGNSQLYICIDEFQTIIEIRYETVFE